MSARFGFMSATVVAGALWSGIVSCPPAAAHEPEPGDPNPGGISYSWTISELTIGESANVNGSVKKKSWKDQLITKAMPNAQEIAAENRGWTHTSNWIAFHLAEDATVTILASPLAGQVIGTAPNQTIAGDRLAPAFTLWSGWDNDLAPYGDPEPGANFGQPIHDWHVYHNAGNMDWAEDLNYVSHAFRETSGSLSHVAILPAGDYSLVIGGNDPNALEADQGYSVTISATSVPEPASAAMTLIVGVMACHTLRRCSAVRSH